MPKKSKKSSSFFYIYLDSYDCKSCKEIRYLLSEYPYEEILNRFPEPLYVVFQRNDENKIIKGFFSLFTF